MIQIREFLMKVVWLCPFPISYLQFTQIKASHPASWIINLMDELKKNNEIELHIITHSASIPKSKHIIIEGVHFYLIKYSFPFTQKGFPSYFPLDRLTRFRNFIQEAIEIINLIKPDLVHSHGTENAYSICAIKSGYPHLISIQGIIQECNKISSTIQYKLQIPIEKFSVDNGKNFGCRTEWDRKFISDNNSNARIYYVPEAVNNIFFQSNWQNPNNSTLLFVGSLMKRKGLETYYFKSCGQY